MAKIHSIEGKIQNYDWGGTEYISELLGKSQYDHRIAEYWLGAHVNAPTVIKETGQSLIDYISFRPRQTLGKKVSGRFGRLPFLFKVLDVEKMLSIQVHPTKLEAEKGFKKENDLGIPLTAAHRNYKDDNHKPEIMVALSDFWLLHGFKPKDQLAETLSQVPEFTFMLDLFKEKGYQGLYSEVMLKDQNEVNSILKPLMNRILPLYEGGKLNKSQPDYWAAKSVADNGRKAHYDRGMYSIYFFNLVNVPIGSAIFQDAGIPHAYLSGQNIELMANSDNVLRAGLTSKHIDVHELLKHIKFEETQPNVTSGQADEDGIETIFHSPAEDFQLSRIVLKAGDMYKNNTGVIEIILEMEGRSTITTQEDKLTINKGQAVCVDASCKYEIVASEDSVLYKATVPVIN